MTTKTTMQKVQRLFEQGRTREQLAKQYKVSTSTIDDWRRKVTGKTTTTVTGKTVIAQASVPTVRRAARVKRVVRKTATALNHPQIARELTLLAMIGDLFTQLAEERYSNHA